MDSLQQLPDKKLIDNGVFSHYFLVKGLKTYKEACLYIHRIPYGYNSNYEDKWILFKENKGSCTTKHAVAAALAEELKIPIFKFIGIYKLTEEITNGANKTCQKYGVPFIPMVHCFLVYFKNLNLNLFGGDLSKILEESYYIIKQAKPFPNPSLVPTYNSLIYRFDLTEGNKNGKKTSIENFIEVRKVSAFISRKDEYLLFRQILDEIIVSLPECNGIPKNHLLKARAEGIKLLKKNI